MKSLASCMFSFAIFLFEIYFDEVYTNPVFIDPVWLLTISRPNKLKRLLVSIDLAWLSIISRQYDYKSPVFINPAWLWTISRQYDDKLSGVY